MEKVDLSKTRRPFFNAGKKPEIVSLPAVRYLSIRGKGDPSGPLFAAHISALYSVAYNLKFALKKAKELDFAVSKLEAQWWFDETQYPGLSISDAPREVPRSEWEYRMMIMLPDFVTESDVQYAVNQVFEKKGMAEVKQLQFETIEEGLCVQMMHEGPFSREPETLLLMKEFMDARRFHKNGLHHEVYLSDFNKTAPEKLKTILREPVREEI